MISKQWLACCLGVVATLGQISVTWAHEHARSPGVHLSRAGADSSYDPDILYARALQDSKLGNWHSVAHALAKIPLDQRTPAMRQLRTKADLYLKLERVSRLASQGEQAEAMGVLGEVRAAAANDLDVLNQVARAYLAMGESARGLALLRPLRVQGGERGVDASIAYISLLLESGQEVEAAVLLRRLQEQSLTPTQQRLVDKLNDTHLIRRALSSIEREDFHGAHDLIASVLARHPDHLEGLQALARLHLAAEQAESAKRIYQQLVDAGYDSAVVRLGLAESALMLQDQRQARRQADTAVELAPASIEVLTRAAEIHHALGRDQDAAELRQRVQGLSLEANPDLQMQ